MLNHDFQTNVNLGWKLQVNVEFSEQLIDYVKTKGTFSMQLTILVLSGFLGVFVILSSIISLVFNDSNFVERNTYMIISGIALVVSIFIMTTFEHKIVSEIYRYILFYEKSVNEQKYNQEKIIDAIDKTFQKTTWHKHKEKLDDLKKLLNPNMV